MKASGWIMDKNTVLEILRIHAPELKAAGVAHLRLFGSIARDEANEHSDIDLMADLDPAMKVTLFTLGGLQHQVNTLLGTEVDLTFTAMMREPIRQRALREAIIAF
ncbi:nucleotidyltransferase [Granulicella sp. WH15]|uniref:nucleotidyltransferase family protein n=1 Tax=Granulicella sp. WH15 TaxID=2602070 RepID=UPI001366F6E7|nr:nucleotidyltransferase domain-containing protein [Granulicella sp. WH15]QHN02499.1 nucleotidyltransferase [Granulicella sp. WH15]